MKAKCNLVGCIFAILISCSIGKGQTNQASTFKITPEDVIDSVQIHNWQFDSFENTANAYALEQTQLKTNLLAILNATNSPVLNQYCTAYYLGELKAQEGVTNLSAKIKLSLNDGPVIFVRLPGRNIPQNPAMQALIKIGNPSIPAVIRNLAESDDPKVRELSLQVLAR